jgi:hypothetical protein
LTRFIRGIGGFNKRYSRHSKKMEFVGVKNSVCGRRRNIRIPGLGIDCREE